MEDIIILGKKETQKLGNQLKSYFKKMHPEIRTASSNDMVRLLKKLVSSGIFTLPEVVPNTIFVMNPLTEEELQMRKDTLGSEPTVESSMIPVIGHETLHQLVSNVGDSNMSKRLDLPLPMLLTMPEFDPDKPQNRTTIEMLRRIPIERAENYMNYGKYE